MGCVYVVDDILSQALKKYWKKKGFHDTLSPVGQIYQLHSRQYQAVICFHIISSKY